MLPESLALWERNLKEILHIYFLIHLTSSHIIVSRWTSAQTPNAVAKKTCHHCTELMAWRSSGPGSAWCSVHCLRMSSVADLWARWVTEAVWNVFPIHLNINVIAYCGNYAPALFCAKGKPVFQTQFNLGQLPAHLFQWPVQFQLWCVRWRDLWGSACCLWARSGLRRLLSGWWNCCSAKWGPETPAGTQLQWVWQQQYHLPGKTCFFFFSKQ